MEVVTADAQVVTADDLDHSDLFWGLRGGSGSFGVVTEFKYRLIPIDRLVVAGATYPMSQRREVLRFFRDFLANAPDELTAEAEFGFPYPTGVFGIGSVYCGRATEAERVLKPLTSFDRPLESSRARSYLSSKAIRQSALKHPRLGSQIKPAEHVST